MSDKSNKINNELNEVTSILAESNSKRKSKKPLIITIIIVSIIAIASPFIVKFIANTYTGGKLTRLFDSFKGQCYIIYNKSNYDVIKRRLKVYDVSLICGKDEVATFKEINFLHIVSGEPIPANTSAEITGGVVNFDADIFGKYGKGLALSGIKTANFSGHISATLGPVSKIFKIETLNLNFENLGSLEAEFKIENINATTTLSALRQIYDQKFSNIWVSFQDNGFVKQIISAYGDRNKVHTSIARQQALERLLYRIEATFVNDESMRNNLIQIYRFIENPTTITFKSDSKDYSIKEIVNGFNSSSLRKFIASIQNFPFVIEKN